MQVKDAPYDITMIPNDSICVCHPREVEELMRTDLCQKLWLVPVVGCRVEGVDLGPVARVSRLDSHPG